MVCMHYFTSVLTLHAMTTTFVTFRQLSIKNLVTEGTVHHGKVYNVACSPPRTR